VTASHGSVFGLMAGLRLNLGCGPVALSGFVNVDALDLPGVEVVADLGERLPFDDGSADLLYASHVLEHFPTGEVPRLLRDWRRVLREGGTVLIAVPDLDVIAQLLIERRGWFTPPNAPWLGAIYGGQKDDYDFHKTGFTGPWLAALLTDAGFGAVRRVKRFSEVGAVDGSYAPLPFGMNLSLNMRAVAGGRPLNPGVLTPTAVERAFNAIDATIERCMWYSTMTRARLMNRRRRRIERELISSEDGEG
jgi:SAM-dependent methyltransferase